MLEVQVKPIYDNGIQTHIVGVEPVNKEFFEAVIQNPQDWCCKTCRWLRASFPDWNKCVEIRTPIMDMDDETARTWGCKFWQRKEE